MPCSALAQRADSSRAGVAPPAARADAATSLPIAPRRAFLTSLVLPGVMQVRLGRPKAATLFLAVEAATIGMSVKSWKDLDAAKSARSDTVGTGVVDAGGSPVIDPVTGAQKISYAPRNPNLADRVRARRTHLEDWLAAVVFNHLFAGADAFVAANLADFDRNVSVTPSASGVRISARVAW